MNDNEIELHSYTELSNIVAKLKEENAALRKELGEQKQWVLSLASDKYSLVKKLKKLDIAVKELKIPISNPKSYYPEVIKWSKYILAEIEKIE